MIVRADLAQLNEAWAIVGEYCDAVGVMLRDVKETFAGEYFRSGSGLWLAKVENESVGCIALRPLSAMPASAEVKRLYVKPQWREKGVADALLDALHCYAAGFGYEWLYLDSKDDLRAAIRFYERRGYARCPRYNDNFQATIFMRRGL